MRGQGLKESQTQSQKLTTTIEDERRLFPQQTSLSQNRGEDQKGIQEMYIERNQSLISFPEE